MAINRLDCEIFLNQLAQNVVRLDEGLNWFATHSPVHQKEILQCLTYMLLQAGGRSEDVPRAISEAGLKERQTPCALLLDGNLRTRLSKATNLDRKDYPIVFRLMLAILAIADERRRNQCAGECAHWWHRNLNDPIVLQEIRSDYEKGELL